MNARLLSLDVFRGITIFFMILVNTPGSWEFVYAPLRHAQWDGLTPTDLVFPFFMFIVGVSMALSSGKMHDKGWGLWRRKAITRGIIIIGIGLLLQAYPFYTKTFAEWRFFGVLQRIGLSFLLAALFISVVSRASLWWWSAVILVVYTGLLFSAGEGALTLEGNLVRQLDLLLVGEGHVYKGYGIPFDPEGLLSTLPAIATVLLGYITGLHIHEKEQPKVFQKWLLYTGMLLILGASTLHLSGLPINKPLWSASYVIVTAGLAMLLLLFLYWYIDVMRFQRGTFFFEVFGANPLVSYILSGLFVKTSFLITVADQNLYKWVYSQIFQPYFGNYPGSLAFAICYTLFIWLFAWLLYRKEIIIKV